jgi:hypothetical protein
MSTALDQMVPPTQVVVVVVGHGMAPLLFQAAMVAPAS